MLSVIKAKRITSVFSVGSGFATWDPFVSIFITTLWRNLTLAANVIENLQQCMVLDIMKKLMLEKKLSSAFCVESGSTSSEVFVSTFIAILWKNLTIATSAIGVCY
ncbi:hypothetical protein Ocin01_18687 [Orchesella cincta]|uniref:Uncharacterized protein n=1 Tax=Orchesella cincta TaxID=48709 RepID=A0A1D2M4U8_ORCCI|nr:hypothetical protein Ocin01_18687 [Orchesella cincta]